MRHSIFKTICTAATLLAGLITAASAQEKLDRTVLPIQEPERPTYSKLDVRKNAKWERLFLYDGKPKYFGSSEIEDLTLEEWGDIGAYSAYQLFDENVTTAWVEGVEGDGIGEYVLIGQENTLPDKIHINNGYQKTESLYYKNSRPKTLKLSLYVVYQLPGDVTELGRIFQCLQYPDSTILHLKDKMGTQVFELPFDIKRVKSVKSTGDANFEKEFEERVDKFIEHEHYYGYILKLEIMDVYKGSKWDDTSISDLWFSREKKEVMNKIYKISAKERISRVFKENGNIFFSTTKQEDIFLVGPNNIEDEIIVVDGDKLNMFLSAVSPDKEWAQIDFYFFDGNYKKVSFLYNVRLRKKVDKALGNDYYTLYGFVEQNGKTYIKTNRGLINLEDVWKLIRE